MGSLAWTSSVWSGGSRYGEHRSLPEIHHRLLGRGVPLAERTLDHLIDRYEELVALHLSDPARLEARLHEQGQVILAIDGVPPDVGHEVLWIIRDCLSGEILLARARLGSSQEDVSALLQEVKDQLPVPVRGLISDGQATIRDAIACVFPRIPHQVCQFHSPQRRCQTDFRSGSPCQKGAKTADPWHPTDRACARRAHRCRSRGAAGLLSGGAAVALTDDGYPPLCASGLKLQDRLQRIVGSTPQVEQKRGFLPL